MYSKSLSSWAEICSLSSKCSVGTQIEPEDTDASAVADEIMA